MDSKLPWNGILAKKADIMKRIENNKTLQNFVPVFNEMLEKKTLTPIISYLEMYPNNRQALQDTLKPLLDLLDKSLDKIPKLPSGTSTKNVNFKKIASAITVAAKAFSNGRKRKLDSGKTQIPQNAKPKAQTNGSKMAQTPKQSTPKQEMKAQNAINQASRQQNSSDPAMKAQNSANQGGPVQTSLGQVMKAQNAANQAGPVQTPGQVMKAQNAANQVGPAQTSPGQTTNNNVTNQAGPAQNLRQVMKAQNAANQVVPAQTSPGQTTNNNVTNQAGPAQATNDNVANQAGPAQTSPGQTMNNNVENQAGPAQTSPGQTTNNNVANQAGPTQTSPGQTTNNNVANQAGPAQTSPSQTMNVQNASHQTGGKNLKLKKTKAHHTYNNRKCVIYEGKRGGKYIRHNNAYVLISKL